MSNGTDCPECAKVILNGGITARVLDETCYTIKDYVKSGGTLANVADLVERANKIENLAFEFAREVMEGVGFHGPWPKSMKKVGD